MTTSPFAGVEMKQADRARSALPGGGTLAAMIRDGATVPELRAFYGVGKQAVYMRLRDAGYAADGHPVRQRMAARPAEVGFLHRPEEWTEQRACAEADPDIFHPEGAGTKQATALAKSICATCPVATQCLDYALRVEDASSGRYGVYGGLTGDERAKLVKNK